MELQTLGSGDTETNETLDRPEEHLFEILVPAWTP